MSRAVRALPQLSLALAVYAVLSLTVVRMRAIQLLTARLVSPNPVFWPSFPADLLTGDQVKAKDPSGAEEGMLR